MHQIGQVLLQIFICTPIEPRRQIIKQRNRIGHIACMIQTVQSLLIMGRIAMKQAIGQQKFVINANPFSDFSGRCMNFIRLYRFSCRLFESYNFSGGAIDTFPENECSWAGWSLKY